MEGRNQYSTWKMSGVNLDGSDVVLCFCLCFFLLEDLLRDERMNKTEVTKFYNKNRISYHLLASAQSTLQLP